MSATTELLIRATDPFGLFTEQTFDVEVVETLQNRPPTFTTDPVTDATASSGFEITTIATGDNPNGVGVVSGFEGPRIVTINSDDQTVGVYAGTGNDRFDDETTFSTGEPERTGNFLNGGETVDVGLPQFLNNTDVNDIFGVDQADFNGDGIIDLASLTYHRSNVLRDGNFHNVVINLGDGDGGFGEPIIVEQFDFVVKSAFENFKIADINGDGTFDFVWLLSQFVPRRDPLFALYTILGNADGTFQPAVVTNAETGIGDFRVVDLDQDGNVDLVGRRQFVDDIGWLRGVGDGTFETFASLSPDDTFTALFDDQSRDFQIIDLDDDGDLDIVQGRVVNRGIQILENDGSLNFTETQVLGAANRNDFISALQVADFTGDGNLDIFYTTSSNDRFFLIKGTADGFETVAQEATSINPNDSSGNIAGDDRPIDIDGDGDLDLLIGKGRPSQPDDDLGARVLLNDGTGFFSNVAYLPIADPNGQPNQDNQVNATFVAGVLTADYNQDGVSDLAIFTSGDRSFFGLEGFDSVSIVLGTRPGEFAANRTIADFTRTDRDVVAADFNNDGRADLLSFRQGMIRLGNGDGSFDEPFQATPGQSLGFNPVLADFNLDGNIDVLLTGEGSTRVLLGNGDGTFELSFTARNTGGDFNSASIADFNGDGFPDIITKGAFAEIDVRLNDPDNPGQFTSSFVVDSNATNGYGTVDTGDFDEDGIIDFVTVERIDPDEGNGLARLQTYKGLGDGTFELANEEFDFNQPLTDAFDTFGQSPSFNLHAEDVNKDGHLDVVAFSSLGTFIHLGNGDGTFEKPTLGNTDEFSRTNDLMLTEVIDFDGDGNLDLVRSITNATLNIQRGFGDGTFSIPERYTFPLSGGIPSFADIDNDGHLDLVFKTDGLSGSTLTDVKVVSWIS